MRLPSPFFSVHIVPLLIHLDGLTLCLSGETGVGLASISAQCGQSIPVPTWAPGQCKVLLPSGLMVEGMALPRVSQWVGAVSGLGLRSPGAFLSLRPDGNRLLGSRGSSEKKERQGALRW